ncbi:MAG: hypothetical protein R2856_28560 [Caldilineaceae bacterium]
MEPRDANLLVDRLLRDTSLMPKLQNEPVRQAVVASEDVDETLAFLTTDPVEVQQSPVAQVGRVIEDRGGWPMAVSWLLSGASTARCVTWPCCWVRSSSCLSSSACSSAAVNPST